MVQLHYNQTFRHKPNFYVVDLDSVERPSLSSLAENAARILSNLRTMRSGALQRERQK